MLQQTSLDAFADVQKEKTELQEEVFRAIMLLQPCSDWDIAHHLHWNINRVTPRRNELVNDLFIIEKKGLKPSPNSNKNCIAWGVV